MAFRYERQIRDALENAPELSGKPSPTANKLSSFAKRPDDFSVRLNFKESEIKPAANEIIVPRTSDLKELHKTLCKLENIEEMNVVVDAEIKHEGEHGIAAKKLGAHSVFYVLRLWRYGELIGWQQGIRPYKLSTSKLGLAVLAAYPHELSLGDEQDIEAMGYDGVTEIGDRVRSFNKRASQQDELPLPLSYGRK